MSGCEFTEDQRDCMQEICNIAMGQAADSLARLMDRFVTLTVPAIQVINSARIGEELSRLIEADTVSAVRQGFYSAYGEQGLRGESIILFNDTSAEALTALASLDGADEQITEEELLLDVANILAGACLNGIADQIEQELGFSAPSLIGFHVPLARLLAVEQLTWDQALSIRIGYRLENQSFQCDMLLLLPHSAVLELKGILDMLLED